jgi:hypothetical protein
MFRSLLRERSLYEVRSSFDMIFSLHVSTPKYIKHPFLDYMSGSTSVFSKIDGAKRHIWW